MRVPNLLFNHGLTSWLQRAGTLKGVGPISDFLWEQARFQLCSRELKEIPTLVTTAFSSLPAPSQSLTAWHQGLFPQGPVGHLSSPQ